jgi:hypothetical protein
MLSIEQAMNANKINNMVAASRRTTKKSIFENVRINVDNEQGFDQSETHSNTPMAN